MRRTLLLAARRKGGQTAWSPNSLGAVNSSPGNLVSPAEASAIAFRPLPPRETAEMEEDLHSNVQIQREYISKRGRAALANFHDVPLAHSETELHEGRKQLGGVMRNASVAMPDTRLDVEYDDETGVLRKAAYLMTADRMQYCTRFCRGVRRIMGDAFRDAPDLDDPQVLLERMPLHGLMEAAAIAFGASGPEREGYWAAFGLDGASIDRDCAEQRRITEEALAVIEAHNAAAQATDGQGQQAGPTTAAASSIPPVVAITADTLDFAPLYAEYLNLATGLPPSARRPVDEIITARHLLAQRLRWRDLLTCLVAEDYHHLADDDVPALQALNDHLHTFKFMDLKVGEIVREVVAAQHASMGQSSSHRLGLVDAAPSHPAHAFRESMTS